MGQMVSLDEILKRLVAARGDCMCLLKIKQILFDLVSGGKTCNNGLIFVSLVLLQYL